MQKCGIAIPHNCFLGITLEMAAEMEYELEKNAKEMGGDDRLNLSCLRNKILYNTLLTNDTGVEGHWYQKIKCCIKVFNSCRINNKYEKLNNSQIV